MNLNFWLIQAFNGISYGALLFLVGSGLSLIFGVMRIVNFAHGAFMMIGMYVTYLLFDQLGVSPYLGFLAAAAVLFVLGAATYHGLLRRIAERSEFMTILLTLGIAQMMIGVAQLVFSGDFRKANSALTTQLFHLGPHLTLNHGDLLSFAISVALATGMFLFVMKSRFGRALRAIAQNRYAASLIGINVQRTQAVAFGLGIAAVGLAGGLLLPALYLYPEVGGGFNLRSFVIVVLGGMGSVEGAAIAGVVLGVVENLTSLYWGNQWAAIVDFVIFLLVLSLKPAGLFGSQRV